MAVDDRVVVLIDMDCFYVQVEQRREPSVRGKPSAVVQYNQWKGGGIIAVSYEARAKGVTRQMRGDDAKQKCPEIILLQVPTANGKADLTRYRDAGAEVISVLLQFGGIVERASIDEAYIDLTNVVNEKFADIERLNDQLPDIEELQNTHVVGYPTKSNSEVQDPRLTGLKQYLATSCYNKHVARLSFAASIVENMRLAIYQQTSFRCSAGISHNKMLSKLACGINKPNKQTILPMNGVQELFQKTKIGKIRNLGGKLGASLALNFKVDYIGQVADIHSQDLITKFGSKTGSWLSEVCHGIDQEPVKERHVAQSVGCSKNFTGSDALDTRAKVKHWVGCLITELVERLNKDKLKNNRVANGLTLHLGHSRRRAISRSCHIERYEADHVISSCLATLELLNNARRDSGAWSPPITMLGISSKNFKDISGGDGNKSVASMLSTQVRNKFPKKSANPPVVPEDKEKSTSRGSIEFFVQETSVQSVGTPKPPPDTSDPEPGTKNVDPSPRPSTPPPKKSFNEAANTSPLMKSRTKSSFFSRMKSSSSDHKTPKPSVVKGGALDSRPTYSAELVNAYSSKIEGTDRTMSFQQAMTSLSMGINEIGSENNIIEETRTELTNAKSPNTVSSAETDCESKTKASLNPGFSYVMADIDQEVFDSLPLYLQQEIQSSARQNSPVATNQSPSTTSGRKRSSNSPSKHNSISKFLRPAPVNFSSKENKKTKQQSKSEEKAKKSRSRNVKKNAHSVYDATSVPLGFFRARSQASAAIHNALQESQRGDSGKTAQVIAPKTAGATKSMWNSSVVNPGPCYKCDECCCMVPISEVSSHSEFHEKRNQEKVKSEPQS